MFEIIIDPFRKLFKQYVEDKMSELRTELFAAHLIRTVVEIQYKENTECWKWEGVKEGGSTVY